MITLLMTLIGDDPKDKERFEKLYYMYEQRVYKRALSFMRNEQDAMDILQEAFVSVAKNFSKINVLGSKETRNYIMTIVENKARNELEKSQKRREAESALADSMRRDSGKSGNEGPYTEVELRDLILSLPDIYSDPLYLFYISEQTVKEISEHLGISRAAVRKRLERARSMLKDMIEEQHE